jgi:hydroxymethylbilane synthase
LPWEVEKVHFENVRGNVPTRLRKLFENPEADGLILAKAALDRLMTAPESEFKDVQNTLLEKMQFLNWQVLPLSVNPTAAAQGALAVECKKSRQDLISMLSEINSEHDRLNVEEERKVLKYHGGGCHQKIGTSIQRRNILGGRHVEIHFLRGLTDQGKVLRQSEFTFEENDQRPSGFVEEQILDSRELWENVQREEIPFDALQVTEAEALLVTKTDALSPDFLKYNLSKTQQFGKTQILWTSGVKTWFDLSKQGCWVNGTLDSMGEDDLPKIYPWMGDVSSWTKVTHAGSPEFENIISVPTYRVHREIKNINLAKIKIIFWRSGTEYIEAVASFPELQDKEAACGFGNSYKTLLHAGVSPEKLHLYLSADEWRRKCLS